MPAKIVAAPWRSKGNVTIEKRYKDKSGDWSTVNESARKVRKYLFIVFVLSLGTFVFLLFFTPPLPNQDKILDKVIHQEPFQNKDVVSEQILTKGEFRYKIYPQFSYELYGLVVSEYDSENVLDVMHKNDPAQIKDLCVVWGGNIETGIYKELKYKSGEFTCFAKPKDNADWSAFSMQHLSNNHLVPASDEVANKIRNASIGDQVYIKGYLSNYEIYGEDGNLISTRGTSVRRDDGGNGACETIYATDFKVLKGKNYIFKVVRNIAGITTFVSFIALLLVIFFV